MAFEVKIANISGSGLSRTVTAEITNTGKKDVCNAWAQVEVFSDGLKMMIDGQGHVRQDLGDIAGKKTVTKQATLRFGLLDGLRMQQAGARIVLTIGSGSVPEQTFNYDYRP
ncbi:MAG: hypothetical protein HYX87_00725 [Chloroflexi bacterium]|nr:hypothetical protein [Chloroflexota bacterium]